MFLGFFFKGIPRWMEIFSLLQVRNCRGWLFTLVKEQSYRTDTRRLTEWDFILWGGRDIMVLAISKVFRFTQRLKFHGCMCHYLRK